MSSPWSDAPIEDPADEPGASSESRGAAQPLPKRRVLVVDDTRAAAFMLGRLLESLGQEVAVCYDAETAMRIALEDVPEIIFSDILMPHIDGYQFARRLRADDLFQQVKLVALSGLDREVDRQLAQEAGFDHHIVKPVTIQVLRSLLQ